jgi:hypothetical protein
MMITLDKDDIRQAISEWVPVSATAKLAMTWYIDTNNEPWKLEIEEVKEQEA